MQINLKQLVNLHKTIEMNSERLNAYRLNWLFCTFDLPTTSKENRKLAHDFRDFLLKNGFIMFQYSVYAKPCSSKEHADSIISKIYNNIPRKGNVILFKITDKQFSKVSMIFSKNRKDPSGIQWLPLEIF